MGTRWLAVVFLALGLFPVTGIAQEQDIIGMSFFGDLYSIQSSTGQVFYLGFTPVLGSTNAMAKDSGGRIFVAGHVALGGPSGIALFNPDRADLTLAAQVPLDDIRGIAFGLGDVLYAIQDEGVDLLYTIDLATGTAQLVGSTGLGSIQSLAFAGGVLYAYANFDTASAPSGLMILNTATGMATDVNPSIDAFSGEFQTLCFNRTGVLYAGSSVLATIDTATGKRHWIVDLPVDVRAMEFLEPISYPMRLMVLGPCPGTLRAALTGASPRDRIAFLYSVGSSGPFTIPSGPCAGTQVELGASVALGVMSNVGELGNARSVYFPVPAGACGQLRIQALNLTTCEISNVVLID
ncbi:MAG: hypothetical protein EYC70_15940 [Planctomycetota bacterium]|nr:MAG: hypothetical protein EYC70_15940 [Planctomycetota bacterium]